MSTNTLISDVIETPDLKHILRDSQIPSIEISSDEVDDITDKWIEIQCFNLNKEDGTGPDDELELPWVVIFGSSSKSISIRNFYVLTYSEDARFLYSFKGLEEAIDLVRRIREKVTIAFQQSKSPYKKTVLN